ncbi:MAG: hypothetical protein WBQ43_07515 [Terriglobales bacterium]
MKAFHSGREAREFVISRIIAEAERENVPLSEVERKMLYYSESGRTLPDMTTIYEDFDRECDSTEYETKIARLIKSAYRRACKDSREDYDFWWAAVRVLKKQDHYILMMIGLAGLRPRGDQLKLLGAGLGIVTCLLLATFLSLKFNIDLSKYEPSQDAFTFYLWAAGVCSVAVSLIFYLAISNKRVNGLISKALGRLVRIYQRSR